MEVCRLGLSVQLQQAGTHTIVGGLIILEDNYVWNGDARIGSVLHEIVLVLWFSYSDPPPQGHFWGGLWYVRKMFIAAIYNRICPP